MPRKSNMIGFGAAAALAAVLTLAGGVTHSRAASRRSESTATVASMLSTKGTTAWVEQSLAGTRTLTGQVPVAVSQNVATYVHAHPADAQLKLRFALPIRDKASSTR